MIYNVDHRNPIPVPPPPEPDDGLIASLGVPAHAIAGEPDLMHHKYVVRDGTASGPARRTGPTIRGRGRRT